MSERTDKLLTEGLAKGYTGEEKAAEIERARFAGKSHDFPNLKNGHYHDEWFADDNGGGQELVETEDGEKYTRLYGGGVIHQEELQKLGITTKDVIGTLIRCVNLSRGGARLHSPWSVEFLEWKYKYSILKKSEEVPLTVGYESIEYKGREVFAHAHILSPVK